ncbi:DUF4270 domain-containing protein [Gelidibacter sp.]|uniref:DUF4270 domain-containing protein n=1 Tax=Gelidibacter sp. TaxID=2018083 RepID=UPI0032640BDD
MRNKKPALKNLFVLVILTTAFVACDKDFISLDSDISGENNFGVSDNKYEVIAYTKKLGPVQTNGLPSNLFGVYKDLVYGNTTANLVTQLSPTVMDPKFPAETTLDSVVVTIPYFSTSKGIEKGVTTYKLDSIFGNGPINFKLYENTYFLRSFDPSSGFDTPQKYYSDRSLSASSQIPLASLRGTELLNVTKFNPSNKEIKLKHGADSTLLAPAMRYKMDPSFWNNKIISKGGSAELSNTNNFQNYFRGIYFEAEAIGNDGNMMLLDLGSTNANITLYYSSPSTGTDDERVKGTYRLNFSNNKINFFDNDFTLAIPEGNPITGDEKLYLKGGQGAMAVINLFGGTDVDNDEGTLTEFEKFKNDFVVTENGKFKKAKRLINEANLVFWVDQAFTQGQEPDRIYIYDTKNKIPLADYNFDSADMVDANNSRINHLGKLQRETDVKDSEGVKYKIKITEHIKNLLLRDSSNVSLGLTVSLNVNTEVTNEGKPRAQKSILSSNNSPVKSLPVSDIPSPKGTVLYGNKVNDENKKLYLEIFYTEPNN